MSQFERRLIVPIATPKESSAREGGLMDERKLEALLTRLYGEGVRDFFALGTTGRFYELLEGTKERALSVCLKFKEQNSREEDPIRLLVGAIEETLEQLEATLEGFESGSEIDGIVLAPGYLEDPWDLDEIGDVLDKTTLPVTVYDLPPHPSGGWEQLTDEQVLEFAAFPGVVSIKDSYKPDDRFRLLEDHGFLGTEDGVEFYYGSEAAFQNAPLGKHGHGLVSGSANLCPEEAYDLVQNPCPETIEAFEKAKKRAKLRGRNFEQFNASVMKALAKKEFGKK